MVIQLLGINLAHSSVSANIIIAVYDNVPSPCKKNPTHSTKCLPQLTSSGKLLQQQWENGHMRTSIHAGDCRPVLQSLCMHLRGTSNFCLAILFFLQNRIWNWNNNLMLHFSLRYCVILIQATPALHPKNPRTPHNKIHYQFDYTESFTIVKIIRTAHVFLVEHGVKLK